MNFQEQWQTALNESALLKSIKRAWDGVDPKRRPLLIGIGIVIVIVLLWSILIAPAMNYSKAAETRVIDAQTDLSWMQRNAGQVMDRQHQSGSYDSLIELALRSAQASGITISRYEPEAQNLRIWIESASLPNCLQWLLQLQRHYGVGFSELDVNRDSGSGLASIRLVLGPGL